MKIYTLDSLFTLEKFAIEHNGYYFRHDNLESLLYLVKNFDAYHSIRNQKSVIINNYKLLLETELSDFSEIRNKHPEIFI